MFLFGFGEPIELGRRFAEALRAFYGTKKAKITLSSTVTNTTRAFGSTDDLIREIIDARIFGGMPYRTSGKDGALIGKKIVKWMKQNYFRPLEETGKTN
jgi:hypothetical protein